MGAFNSRKRVKKILNLAEKQEIYNEEQKLLIAKLLVDNVKNKKSIASIKDVEFKVFSQWGDDGIIQWLIHFLDIPHETFIEFGVQDYRESNTRFLVMNNNWSGLIMDGSENHIENIKNTEYYWKYELEAKSAFVDCDNINELIGSQPFDKDVGLLHIDIDGNDYWIWKEITVISPIIVIIEYNSIFGLERPVTIPYDKDFNRTEAHYSNLYYGASLKALHHLANQKGYAFIGCNSAGNNAYFIRRDKLNKTVREVTLEEGYVLLKARESRDKNGSLNFVSGDNRIKIIRGMPVYNILIEQLEKV